METRNINNPAYLSDVVARSMVKGAFLSSYADPLVSNENIKIKPYIVYLPNGGIISKSTSTMVNAVTDYTGSSAVVTTDGMERWVTVLMRLGSSGTSMEIIIVAGTEAVNADLERPQRGVHKNIGDGDVILGDVRLYYGMLTISPEDIDLSRSESANYLDPALIPVEVYGPPLNAYNNLDEVIQGINSGALDYRYVKKDNAEYINFNVIDVSCTATEIPNGAKKEGAMYYAEDGTDRYLVVNLGCRVCQTACQTCDTGCDATCESGSDTAPFYDDNEGLKRVVLTDPPAGLCTTSCDISCETPASDTVACPSCDGACESHCEGYCQVGCEVSCDVGCEPAAECGSACQTSCESSCQTTCMVYSQT